MTLPPGHFEVSADRHEADQGAGGIEGVDVVLDGIAPLEGRRFRRGVQPGGLADRVGGNPGDLGDLFRGILFHMPGQVFEAVGVFFDEILVVERFLDDDVEKAQGQRLGRSGR